MAYIECKLKSQRLLTTVGVKIYLPCDLPVEVGNKVKGVFTLLHGFTNSGDDWMQMTAAPRYAADNGLALVAPDCGNSFYQDMTYGGAWAGFVTEEMPVLLREMFHLPAERERNFIGGLSMGGYGALYLGLSRPDLYAGCASFSGAVDVAMMLEHSHIPGVKEVFAPIFGPDLRLPEASEIRQLAAKVAALPADQQPKILLTNGFQDQEPYYIRYQNDAVDECMRALPLAHYRRLQWDGVHEWDFWDRSLVYAIDDFVNPGYAAKKLNDWAAPVTETGGAARG